MGFHAIPSTRRIKSLKKDDQKMTKNSFPDWFKEKPDRFICEKCASLHSETLNSFVYKADELNEQFNAILDVADSVNTDMFA